MRAIKEYVVKADNMRRIILHGARYQYYIVKEYENGCIVLEPRESIAPETISAGNPADIDRAVDNFKSGSVSFKTGLSDC